MSTNSSRAAHVAIVGGGPTGLIAAQKLALLGHRVTLFEKMPTVGRKFLVAGHGGLNLTHSESLDNMLARYGSAREFLEPALRAFTPDDLQAWCADLGEKTFVGSSGRVFPQSFRATVLLRSWINRLGDLGVSLQTRHAWHGWTKDGELRVFGPDNIERAVSCDATLIACGGASWPRTGSNGSWVAPIREAGVAVRSLRPSNCGFEVEWSDLFRDRFAGTPLKNVSLSHGDKQVKGEAMITSTGIEGGAIYALSSQLRTTIEQSGTALLHVDLRPDVDESTLADRLGTSRPKESVTNHLKRAGGLSAVGAALMRESTSNQLPTSTDGLAQLAKCVPLNLHACSPIARAISSAGGVKLDEVDDNYMLKLRPGVFVAGEMLDWEAPTGGYLLQAAFSTGVGAAWGIDSWIQSRNAD